VLAGQSGGSTNIATLLTLGRNDITCAVLGSGGFAVGELESAFLAKKGKAVPAEAIRHVQYDPSVHVGSVAKSSARRVFVVGDPTDTTTPFPQQQAFATSLQKAGHHAATLPVKALGASAHGTAHLSLPVAAMCARDADDKRIETALAGHARG
jgi:hypothetical protein